MRYPFGLVFDSAKHLVGRRLRGERRAAMMLSLDPLGAYGASVNGSSSAERPMLTVEQCLAAIEECNTPVVAISGGEPLEYPEIATLTRAILDRGQHLFICTDGALIRRRLHMIPPYTNFFWNVKLDGTASVHDGRARRPGVFVEALDGVKAAKNAGFFVVVTTTIYADTNAADLAGMYQLLHGMHVDGYLLAPANLNRSLGKEARAVLQQEMRRRFREVSATLGGYNLMNLPV